MATTIAFDIYGTLIDTHGVVDDLQEMIGDEANNFSLAWRDKQLEYSFRRGLMNLYEDFSVCTQQSLDYTCNNLNIDLSAEQKRVLMTRYASLPAFDDVEESLVSLKNSGMQLYALSNGSSKAIEGLLASANIKQFFDGVVSVENLKTFKPDPAVYKHFLQETGAVASNTWLISSNPFDVIGAANTGFRSAWIQRSSAAHYDPWGIEPNLVLSSLSELADKIKTATS